MLSRSLTGHAHRSRYVNKENTKHGFKFYNCGNCETFLLLSHNINNKTFHSLFQLVLGVGAVGFGDTTSP